ncbi:hypothetical protein ABZ642_45570 [Streptomyces sp. NPDC007157]|uniref:hypothetical protein n=1 Tax=Streptomyces sp. NPDC007157 TaxID=3154681 RepID=UPI0033D3D3BE
MRRHDRNDHICVYPIRRVAVDWIAEGWRTPRDTDVIRARLLLEDYACWSPRRKQPITDNDGSCVNRQTFALPAPRSWEHNATGTLLGDAAHLMPPLGVGVSLAMLDASDPALSLANAATVEGALHACEKTVLRRDGPSPRRRRRAPVGHRTPRLR